MWKRSIREIPDHATFRVKGANLAWLDKLGGCLSLALCNLTKFDHLWFPKNSVLIQLQYVKKLMNCSLFPNVNHGGLEVFCIFLKYLLK